MREAERTGAARLRPYLRRPERASVLAAVSKDLSAGGGLEKEIANFPGIGKSHQKFSKAWKNARKIFQALERAAAKLLDRGARRR
jgi:hypothetical protein